MTELEIVAVDDFMPHVLWTNKFMAAQGYASENTIVYQDNASVILLKKNGKESSSKRTQHFNVRYYFIMDCIGHGEMNIEHCPTTMMVADFYTKPLQGSDFERYRNFILGITDKLAVKASTKRKSVLDSDNESAKENNASQPDTNSPARKRLPGILKPSKYVRTRTNSKQ